MVDYMNTDNMPHKHVTLSNDPRDEIYLDHTAVVRYQGIISRIEDTMRLFKTSTTDNNNYAAQVKTLQDMVENINNKIRSECRHVYIEQNGKTIFRKLFQYWLKIISVFIYGISSRKKELLFSSGK